MKSTESGRMHALKKVTMQVNEKMTPNFYLLYKMHLSCSKCLATYRIKFS